MLHLHSSHEQPLRLWKLNKKTQWMLLFTLLHNTAGLSTPLRPPRLFLFPACSFLKKKYYQACGPPEDSAAFKRAFSLSRKTSDLYQQLNRGSAVLRLRVRSAPWPISCRLPSEQQSFQYFCSDETKTQGLCNWNGLEQVPLNPQLRFHGRIIQKITDD